MGSSVHGGCAGRDRVLLIGSTGDKVYVQG